MITTTVIAGRAARITTVRVRHANKSWGYYNRMIVRFLDTNETHSMGAAQFAKWATALERSYSSAVGQRQGPATA